MEGCVCERWGVWLALAFLGGWDGFIGIGKGVREYDTYTPTLRPRTTFIVSFCNDSIRTGLLACVSFVMADL